MRTFQPNFSDISTSYDIMNRVTGINYTFAGQTKTAVFNYGKDGLKAASTLISGAQRSTVYDSLNRETSMSIGSLNRSVSYLNVSGNRTTTLPASLNYTQGGTTLLGTSYSYDSLGNITSMTIAGVTYTYTYDALNQLKTVSTSDNSYTASYSYDNGGNITSKTVNGTTISYGYGDTNWTDKLTSYNGQSITYDNLGNPSSYRGMTMDWTGRRLDSIVNNGTTSSYLYDANGIRTRKTVGSTTTEYFTSGSTILAQKTGDTVLWFIYDSDGEILGFTYNGTPYYYVKNAQGDVMRIVDADGTNRATYSYDPWGKVLSATGSMAQINPIRYRSYYYDKETSLYYLQSRYYDPEIGRFINADGLLGANQDLLSYNLYAYCSNNPINCSDPTGQFALGILVAGLAALTFAAVGASLLAAGGIVGAQAAQKQLQGTPHYNPPAARPFPTYNDIMNNPAVGIAPSGEAAAQTKEQEKISANQSTSIATFYGADIQGGTWKTVTAPMKFEEALVWVDTTAAAHIYGKGASWGLYTNNQAEAITMATVLGFGQIPIYHIGDIGQYPHYHVGGFSLFGTYKHFHLWYGTMN